MALIFLVLAVFTLAVVYGMFWSAGQRRRAVEAAVGAVRQEVRSRKNLDGD